MLVNSKGKCLVEEGKPNKIEDKTLTMPNSAMSVEVSRFLEGKPTAIASIGSQSPYVMPPNENAKMYVGDHEKPPMRGHI